MWFHTLLDCLMSQPNPNRKRPAAPRPATCRLAVEPLEDRRTPAAMLTIGDVSVLEGNDGVQNALVTVRLTEPHANSVTVNYNTAGGSALAGSDYTAVSGQLTFARNEMAKSILVPIRGDRLVESYENVWVRLSNPKGAKIADGESYVAIIDDEPRISISGMSALEGNSGRTALAFTVSLSRAYDQPVTVNFATFDGTAIAGEDYLPVLGTLTFAPGETTKTITVEVIGDTTPEPEESFYVQLSDASANALTSGGAAGWIADDDGYVPPPDEGDDGWWFPPYGWIPGYDY